MPKAAVLLATYNGAKYLEDQIFSIQQQKNVSLDIFLRDDNSKDETIIIARTLLDADKITVNQKGTGSAANNFFLSVLNFENVENYDYFAFSDQDDIWLPQKLEKGISQLVEKNAQLYTSNLMVWDSKKNSKTILRKDEPQKAFDYLFEGGSAGCTYVFTKEFFSFLQEKLNCISYLNWPFFSHDWFTYFMARQHNFKVVNASDAEILYRIHETNVHGQLNIISVNSVLQRIKLVKDGWYLKNSENFAKCIDSDSEEFKIYKMYCQNSLTRTKCILKYNFKLMRSRKKFLAFCALSLLFSGYSNENTFNDVFQVSK